MSEELETIVNNAILEKDLIWFEDVVYKLTIHKIGDKAYFTIHHPNGDLVKVFKSPLLAKFFAVGDLKHLYVIDLVFDLYKGSANVSAEVLFNSSKSLTYTIDRYQYYADKYDLKLTICNTISYSIDVDGEFKEIINIVPIVGECGITHKVCYKEDGQSKIHEITSSEDLYSIETIIKAVLPNKQSHFDHYYNSLRDYIKPFRSDTLADFISFGYVPKRKYFRIETPELQVKISIEDTEDDFARVIIKRKYSYRLESRGMKNMNELKDFLMECVISKYGRVIPDLQIK